LTARDVIGHLPRRVQVAIHAQSAGEHAARAAELHGQAETHACVALRAPGVQAAASATHHAAVAARSALEAAHAIADRIVDAEAAAIPGDLVCDSFLEAMRAFHAGAVASARSAQGEATEAAASHAEISRRVLEAFE
jgi:hypothetical protein